MPAAQAAREVIHENGQIDKLALQADRGDFCCPDLIRPGNFQIFDEVVLRGKACLLLVLHEVRLGAWLVSPSFFHPVKHSFTIDLPTELTCQGGEATIAVVGSSGRRDRAGRP